MIKEPKMKHFPQSVSLETAIRTRIAESRAAIQLIEIELEQVEATLEEEPNKLNWSDAGSVFHVTEILEALVSFLNCSIDVDK
jgi:hypothetical protein